MCLIETEFVWRQSIQTLAIGTSPGFIPRTKHFHCVEMAGDSCLHFPSLLHPFPRRHFPISLVGYTYPAVIMRRNKAVPW